MLLAARNLWGYAGGWLACALALAIAPSTRADASAGDSPVYLVLPSSSARRSEAEGLIDSWSAASGITLRNAAELPAGPGANDSPEALLSVLSEVERALLEARELSGQLREAAALRVLAAAEEALLAALEVPGAHAFLAEVYVQLGLCAAQLGERGLLETALERALSLDPNRRIEAAEAPPAILLQARAIARAHDLLPISEGVLQPEPRAATAWLDGAPLGSGASPIRARSGVHVLVVRAPGHAPYATLLNLLPGKRPPLHIALSPDRVEQARLSLLAASAVADGEVRATLLAGLRGAPVYLFESGRGPLARVLVHRCAAEGCALVAGAERDGRGRRGFRSQREARAWLNAAPDKPEPSGVKPLWKRWPLWTAGSALVLAGVAAAIWARPAAATREQRELEIESGALAH